MTYRLTSLHRQALEEARQRLRPWLRPEASDYWADWQLVGADENWVVRCSRPGQPERKGQLPELLMHVEYQAVAWLYTFPNLLVLHGALLRRHPHSLVILGPPEAGKSTLALSLWQRAGWQLLSDDCIVLQATSRDAWPGPRRLSLRHSSRNLLQEAWAELAQQAGSDPGPKGLVCLPPDLESCPPAQPVTHGILLQAATGDLIQLHAAEALLGLLPYSNIMQRGHLPTAMAWCQSLGQSAQWCRLGREALDHQIHRVENWISGGFLPDR